MLKGITESEITHILCDTPSFLELNTRFSSYPFNPVRLRAMLYSKDRK